MKDRIALLAWGSLLWDKNEQFDAWHEQWKCDGPMLQIEFSRISSSRSGALTLVIDLENGTSVPVCWSLSRRSTISAVAEDLRIREKTSARYIRWLSFEDETNGINEQYLVTIRDWVTAQDLDGVVWTDLPSNFAQKTGEPFSVDAALRYLATLQADAHRQAFEYIQNAPPFIQTPLRTALF